MATPDAGMPRPSSPRVLTPREREVMRLMALGLTYQEIADELGIGIQTIKNHVSSAQLKLGTDNRIESLIALGWLTVPER